MTTTAFANQQGMALFVAMIILLVLSVIGVSILSTSKTELNIAGNAQEVALSVQASQSGLEAVSCLVGTVNDPFNKIYKIDPALTATPARLLSTDVLFDKNPFDRLTAANCSVALGQVTNINADVFVKQVAEREECPRATKASSLSFKCNNYIVRSENAEPSGVHTDAYLGVIKRLLAGPGN
jgi:Tfp pilus assembly protein PilX